MRRDGGRPPSDRNRGRGNPPRKEVKDLIKTATMTMISISISTTMKMITSISILKWQQPCAVSTHQSVSPLPHHCHGLAPQLHQNQNHHEDDDGDGGDAFFVLCFNFTKTTLIILNWSSWWWWCILCLFGAVFCLFVCFVTYMYCIICLDLHWSFYNDLGREFWHLSADSASFFSFQAENAKNIKAARHFQLLSLSI